MGMDEAPELSAEEQAIVARFETAAAAPESSPVVRAMLELADDIEGFSKRCFQADARAVSGWHCRDIRERVATALDES